jgi:hypothetical protein
MVQESSHLLKEIIALEKLHHTRAPILHEKCIPGTCTMLGSTGCIFVCARNSRMVHVCDASCTYVETNEDDELVCTLTGIIKDPHVSDTGNYAAPQKRPMVINQAETHINTIVGVVRVIAEAIASFRGRSVEHSLRAAMEAAPCPPSLHEYAAWEAFYHAKFYSEFDTKLASIAENIIPFSQCIYRLWFYITKAAPTPRRLTFFTIICFFFFKSGKLVPAVFHRIDAFSIAHSKLLVINYVQRAQQKHQFSPQSITDSQNSCQAMFRAAGSAQQAEMASIVAQGLPWKRPPDAYTGASVSRPA